MGAPFGKRTPIKPAKKRKFPDILDPVRTCIECGQPAMIGTYTCKDCTVEATKSKHLPSPEEIRQQTLELQSGWSDYERHQRAGIMVEPVETKVVRMGFL